jgi:hypothetical protein
MISQPIVGIMGSVQIKTTRVRYDKAIRFRLPKRSNVYPTPIEIISATSEP